MSDTIFRIPTSNLARLTEEVAKINRKTAKLGCEPVVLHYHGVELETKKQGESEYQIEYTHVTATGVAPKLDGWRLVAAVERVASGEKQVRTVPGVSCPTGFRTRDNTCDHCQTKRFRKEVFVLAHDDGRHVQVGRQCVADFLGGQSPERLLGSASCLWAWQTVASEAETLGWGGSAEVLVPPQSVLVTAALVVRKIGWQPKSNCPENRIPTSHHVQRLLWPAYGADAERQRNEFIKDHDLFETEADVATATAALEWGKALPTDTQNDYLYSLGVACRNPTCDAKGLGLLVSVIAAHQRELGKEVERAQAAKTLPSAHVGVLDVRQVFGPLTVTFSKHIESDYGVQTLVKFVDADGNRLVWWGSGDVEWATVGAVVTVKATPKKHTVFNGVAETNINRVVPV